MSRKNVVITGSTKGFGLALAKEFLNYGDNVVIHFDQQKYIYEIQTTTVVEPDDLSIFEHEELAWLTLVTCREYDEMTNTYGKRVVVRAVLVDVTR